MTIENVNGVINNDSRLFDFEKEKVQVLTLDQLERTHKENDVYGNPIRGIYHYELLNNVIGMCREQGYDVEVESEGSCKQISGPTDRNHI